MEIAQLANYGALGLMVLILISLVYYLLKDHKEERKSWNEQTSKDKEKANAVIDKIQKLSTDLQT